MWDLGIWDFISNQTDTSKTLLLLPERGVFEAMLLSNLTQNTVSGLDKLSDLIILPKKLRRSNMSQTWISWDLLFYFAICRICAWRGSTPTVPMIRLVPSAPVTNAPGHHHSRSPVGRCSVPRSRPVKHPEDCDGLPGAAFRPVPFGGQRAFETGSPSWHPFEHHRSIDAFGTPRPFIDDTAAVSEEKVLR